MAGCHCVIDVPSLGIFQILEDGESLPSGWMNSSGHIIFDVKMDFTRKARNIEDSVRYRAE